MRNPTRLSQLIRDLAKDDCGPQETDALVLQTLGLFGDEAEQVDILVELAEVNTLREPRHTGDDLWVIPSGQEAPGDHNA